MPSMTAGHTLTAAALEDLLGLHSSPQLVPIAQSDPVDIVEMSFTICMTVHSSIATATSLCAESSLGTPTTSLTPLAPITPSTMPVLIAHLRRRKMHCRI